ncbi:tau 95 subunit of transcription factor TFIIIC [Sorochytrium milnesiophthora]
MAPNTELSYECAPSLDISKRELWAVEYPSYVRSVDNALKSLGGASAVHKVGRLSHLSIPGDVTDRRNDAKAFNGSPHSIAIRFRPDDPSAHPMYGEVVSTCDMLVKVTRRRRRKKRREGAGSASVEQQGDWQHSVEIVGLVRQTARFRAITDFQWIQPKEDPMSRLSCSLRHLDLEKLKEVRLGKGCAKLTLESLGCIAPPIFSRVEWPLSYDFERNPAVVKVRRRQPDGTYKVVLVNRLEREKAVAIFRHADSTDPIPTAPLPAAAWAPKIIRKEEIDLMVKLFEERPMWTKVAIMARLLPMHAYYMSNGPYQKVWVRFGVDPTSDRKYRMYQIIDIRDKLRASKIIRAGRKKVIDRIKRLAVVQPETNENDQRQAGVFDGQQYLGDTSLYQLIDITDPVLQDLIHTDKYVRENFHLKHGWFYSGVFVKLRARMRKRRQAQTQGTPYEPPTEDEFDIVITSDDDDDKAFRGASSTIPPLMAAEMPEATEQQAASELETRVQQHVAHAIQSIQARTGLIPDEDDAQEDDREDYSTLFDDDVEDDGMDEQADDDDDDGDDADNDDGDGPSDAESEGPEEEEAE